MIYEIDDDYQNYFIPSMREVDKIKGEDGKVIRKVMDKAQSPFKRVLADNTVAEEKKEFLIKRKEKMDRFKIKRERDQLIPKCQGVEILDK